jgi:hypothetical protein
MRAGDYVRYVGPAPLQVESELPPESVAQVEHWVNNFRHGDHNCSTWLFRPVYPEMILGCTLSMPIERGYSYGIACDYEAVTPRFKQHLVEVERGLRVAEKFLG